MASYSNSATHGTQAQCLCKYNQKHAKDIMMSSVPPTEYLIQFVKVATPYPKCGMHSCSVYIRETI